MGRFLVFFLLSCVSFLSFANNDKNSSQLLNSKELVEIKEKYESCVLKQGRVLLAKVGFKEAMEYAPLACRKDLLQAKRYLLESAFKIEVIDQLVTSIEEGVKINLANDLIARL